MNNGGKGSKRRPTEVDDSVVENNWNNIFSKKEQEEKREKPEPDSRENLHKNA